MYRGQFRRWVAAPIPPILIFLCAGCASPVSFSRGEPIAMGSYTLKVSHAEVASRDERSQNLAVHYRCDEVDSLDAARRFRMLFAGRITVTDADGNEYETLLPTTAGTYRSYRSGFGNRRVRDEAELSTEEFTPNQWVAVARVPNASRGFTLVISNPDRRDGQTAVAQINLGR